MTDAKYTTLKTTIDRVVVYLDGARIFRSGKSELKKGFQQVRVKGLTKNLRVDSVRVSGKGKGSLGAIDVESVYQEEVSHEELNRLLLEAKKLQKDIDVLQHKINFTNTQHERMKNLSDKFSVEFPQWLASGETELATLSTFIDFESKKNADYIKKAQTMKDEMEKFNLKLSTLQAKINEYQNMSRVERTYDLVIAVEVATTGPFMFEFSYQTMGVNWTPTYDVDLKPANAVLKGMAQIVNRTLEDWVDVKLEISTAVFKPLRVIEPDPFYIDIYDPYARPPPSPGRARMKAKKMASAPMMIQDMRKEDDEGYYEEELEAMIEPTADLKESPTGVQSFDISGKWTIPSDGNNHPVTLTTHELKTEKEFYWSSIDGLGVIAQDKITNGDAIILAGNAKVYSEGEFIGQKDSSSRGIQAWCS
ncbi:MAG: mucoidy inhibitor MuiA family protein [Candidatus Heimdallarchaeota archaeon]